MPLHTGFRVFEVLMLYFAYLDEFGHDGAFISRDHQRYKTSPIFGLGGFVVPNQNVRQLATFFYKQKSRLLKFELDQSKKNAYEWEKKGSSLYTVKNVRKYPELRKTTNRLLSEIAKNDGFIFYHGMEKQYSPTAHNAEATYRFTLQKSIRMLDEFCAKNNDRMFIIIDQSGDERRKNVLETSGKTMFGAEGCRHLIEPPVQAESHLYQTLQYADWICGLLGRLCAHTVCPAQYEDYGIFKQFFEQRVETVSKCSRLHYSQPKNSQLSEALQRACRIISLPDAQKVV